MHIGFTGTRKGMTGEQYETLRQILTNRIGSTDKDECGHGDCVGSDEQFHHTAKELGYKVVAFPPDKDPLRAWCPADIIHPVKPYIERDHDMVDWADEMIASPKSTIEEWRGSGTWTTIRYSKKTQTPITIIFPDGSVKHE